MTAEGRALKNKRRAENPEVDFGEDLIDLSGISLRELDAMDGTVLAAALQRSLEDDQAGISSFDAFIRPANGHGSSRRKEHSDRPG